MNVAIRGVRARADKPRSGDRRGALGLGRITFTLTAILGLAAGAARAQAPAAATSAVATSAPPKKYHNKMQFHLPFQLPDAERAALREVHLYVKRGNDNWVCIEKALPAQKFFAFRAPQDGEYCFSIATVDLAGKATPADVSREAPALIVVVDTQPPQIEMALVPAPSGGMAIHCDVRDANPSGKCRVECQMADMTWMPVEALPSSPDLYPAPDEKTWTGLVRCSATDLAENVAMREANLKPAASAVVPASANIPAPLPTTLTQATEMPTAHVANKPEKAEKQVVVVPAGPGDRHLINTTHAMLNYQIDEVGPSGVGRVEVWMTADEGKTWQKLCEDKNRRSPVEFDLPGEGVYGLSVAVTNGYGMGDPPPTPGTAPDYVIEVDATRPSAQIVHARPALGDTSGALHITWVASDKNFGPEPISLYYAQKKEGPWTTIVENCRNEGNYRWMVPHEVGPEFFLRLKAIDKAGNTTLCETPDKVVLDLSRPKAKVLGVTAGTPRPGAPAGN